MYKKLLEIKPVEELLRNIYQTFGSLPIVSKDCIKVLNSLIYNMQHIPLNKKMSSEIMVYILKGFTSEDLYLKYYIYLVLIEMSRFTDDGLLSINCLLKDINNSKIPLNIRNTALRALFSSLPKTMHHDFQKYLEPGLLNKQDNSVVLQCIYFADTKIPIQSTGNGLIDYHISYISRSEINEYSSMIEIKRLMLESPEKILKYIGTENPNITVLEACKCISEMRPEIAISMVDKARHSIESLIMEEKIIQVYAGLKILYPIAQAFPQQISSSNRLIENLIDFQLKGVSVLSILTLFKTGNAGTIEKLALKLRGLIRTMSTKYKIMAVDTMEGLYYKNISSDHEKRNEKNHYIEFLLRALEEKGDFQFKRHCLRKIERLLNENIDYEKLVGFLCSYMEDPEYFELNLDILDICGKHVESSTHLIHIYNRIIVENVHVKKAALQAISNFQKRLHKKENIGNINLKIDEIEECYKETFLDSRNEDNERLCKFLESTTDVLMNNFSMDELGDIQEKIIPYLGKIEGQEISENADDPFIKECSRIELTDQTSDFGVSIVKKVYKDGVILSVSVENRLPEGIMIMRGKLSLVTDKDQHFTFEYKNSDFSDGVSLKEIQTGIHEDEVFNGVFQYKICMEDDRDESEEGSSEFVPFNITLLDFVRPCIVQRPQNSKTLTISLGSKPSDAISHIVDTCNMYLEIDKNSFVLSGMYNKMPLVILGETHEFDTSTEVDLRIFSDSSELIERVVKIFE